jgi:hypothetical protein
MTMAHPVPLRRRRFNVHPIQQKYFFLSLAPLFFFFVTLVLLVLFPPNIGFMGLDPDLERPPTLGEVFTVMDARVWLALLISMLFSCLLSYLVTNKFAGHLYRIEQVLERSKEGVLPPTLQVRKGDDLREFVELLDGSFKTIAAALAGINAQQGLAAQKLTELRGRIRGDANGEMREAVEEICRHLQELEKILASFKLPAAVAPSPHKE